MRCEISSLAKKDLRDIGDYIATAMLQAILAITSKKKLAVQWRLADADANANTYATALSFATICP